MILRPAFSAIRVYALSPNKKAAAIATFLLLFMPTFIIAVCGLVVFKDVRVLTYGI